jgi:hypothetical protein
MPLNLAFPNGTDIRIAKFLFTGITTVIALLLSGCSSTAEGQIAPTATASPTNLLSLQDVRASHSYLTGKECKSPEEKRVSASLTVKVVVCDHAPSMKFVAVVGDGADGFAEAVSRFEGASQAMGNNWMVAVTPGPLSKSDYRIGGIDNTEIEADYVAKKLDGWVKVSPDLEKFYR